MKIQSIGVVNQSAPSVFANVSKNNKQPKKNKLYEYTRDALALWGVILTIYLGYDLFVIGKKIRKLKI